MTDDNRFDDLAKRLKAAEDGSSGKTSKNSQKTEDSPEMKRNIGIALRMGTEFVAGVVVGVVFGLLIDHYFGTSPVGLIVLFIMGCCAGFMNVYRAVNRMGYRVGYNHTPDNDKQDH